MNPNQNRKSGVRLKPPFLSRLHIPESILKTTATYLKLHGRQGKECMVFWCGKILGKTEGKVTNCIYPNQKSTAVGVQIDPDEVSKIQYLLIAREEFLLAQVHTHPGVAFHSSIDNNYPLTHKLGFLSIVVSNFGATDLLNFSGCRVFEYQGFGRWRGLGRKEVGERLRIVQGE